MEEFLLKRKEELLESGYNAYCLFCYLNNEDDVSNELNNTYPFVLATPLYRMVHRSSNSIKSTVKEILIKNYVFLYIPKDIDINLIKNKFHFFRVLNIKSDSGILHGSDLAYAEWILENNGLIDVSQAIKLNNKVKIISGPLKHLEGSIVAYSKRNRNCCIEIHFVNQTIKTWLPFEWVDLDY